MGRLHLFNRTFLLRAEFGPITIDEIANIVLVMKILAVRVSFIME